MAIDVGGTTKPAISNQQLFEVWKKYFYRKVKQVQSALIDTIE